VCWPMYKVERVHFEIIFLSIKQADVKLEDATTGQEKAGAGLSAS